MLLLLGPSSTILLAHEGHEHRGRQGRYGEREEDTGRYDPQYEDGRREDEDEEDDSYRPSPRRYPPLGWERSAPRQRQDGSRW